jgi:phage protein D
MGELARGKLSGSFEGVGNPNLFAEGVVKLEGFDPDADGEYLAKSVAHLFNKRGYTTSVQFETVGANTD